MALTDQRVVVIGGSSGMGLATARAAAESGAVVTIASSSSKRVNDALAELPETCDGVALDIRDEAAVADLFARVGELDHVVFTAGDSAARRPLAEFPLDEARQLFEVRFWGAVAVAKHAAPRIQSGGSITLTSGTMSVRPLPGAALVSAGANATEGLARGLAFDLAPIRVNAVRCGAIRTPLWNGIPEPQREVVLESFAQRALTKSVGTAEQIAATHLYLMENQFVTGTILTVDGGALLT